MKFGTLIFDWDGTIHNTEDLYGNAFRMGYSWLVEHGYAPERYYSNEETSRYLGLNPPDMWKAFMPELDDEIKDFCSKLVGDAMESEIYAGHASLYPGAVEMLTELKEKGYNMVILSNCKHDYQQAHRKVFELDRFFNEFYACEDFGYAPKEEIFKTLSERNPGPYCVIGDRDSDLKTARVHGLKSIGCLYGFPNPGELDSAGRQAKDVSELPKLIAELEAELQG